MNVPAPIAAMPKERLIALVRELKKAQGAVILAHNYQEGPIQEVADFLGDSLKLAQYARRVEEPVILFCGVHFMAETAAILCPGKKVIVPDPAAGCSLADTVMPGQIRRWREQHPEGVVVCYINTSAAVKAECDLCCTSSNAIAVVESVPPEKEILFVPDYYLGSYVRAKTGRKIDLWKGYCPSHAVIDPAQIERLQDLHPEAEFLMHPECGCLTKQIDLADRILSTDGMIQYVRQSPCRAFIVATDNGILYRMQKENPEKRFLPASEHARCHHMERNTLEKVYRSLVTLQHEITVAPEIARRALGPIERMLAITNGAGHLPERSMSDTEDWVLELANDLR